MQPVPYGPSRSGASGNSDCYFGVTSTLPDSRQTVEVAGTLPPDATIIGSAQALRDLGGEERYSYLKEVGNLGTTPFSP